MTGKTCTTCGRDQLAAASCEPDPQWPTTTHTGAQRCRDCGVLPGGLHHPLCCIAMCAQCGDQLLFDPAHDRRSA